MKKIMLTAIVANAAVSGFIGYSNQMTNLLIKFTNHKSLNEFNIRNILSSCNCTDIIVSEKDIA